MSFLWWQNNASEDKGSTITREELMLKELAESLDKDGSLETSVLAETLLLDASDEEYIAHESPFFSSPARVSDDEEDQLELQMQQASIPGSVDSEDYEYRWLETRLDDSQRSSFQERSNRSVSFSPYIVVMDTPQHTQEHLELETAGVVPCTIHQDPSLQVADEISLCQSIEYDSDSEDSSVQEFIGDIFEFIGHHPDEEEVSLCFEMLDNDNSSLQLDSESYTQKTRQRSITFSPYIVVLGESQSYDTSNQDHQVNHTTRANKELAPMEMESVDSGLALLDSEQPCHLAANDDKGTRLVDGGGKQIGSQKALEPYGFYGGDDGSDDLQKEEEQGSTQHHTAGALIQKDLPTQPGEPGNRHHNPISVLNTAPDPPPISSCDNLLAGADDSVSSQGKHTQRVISFSPYIVVWDPPKMVEGGSREEAMEPYRISGDDHGNVHSQKEEEQDYTQDHIEGAVIGQYLPTQLGEQGNTDLNSISVLNTAQDPPATASCDNDDGAADDTTSSQGRCTQRSISFSPYIMVLDPPKMIEGSSCDDEEASAGSSDSSCFVPEDDVQPFGGIAAKAYDSESEESSVMEFLGDVMEFFGYQPKNREATFSSEQVVKGDTFQRQYQEDLTDCTPDLEASVSISDAEADDLDETMIRWQHNPLKYLTQLKAKLQDLLLDKASSSSDTEDNQKENEIQEIHVQHKATHLNQQTELMHCFLQHDSAEAGGLVVPCNDFGDRVEDHMKGKPPSLTQPELLPRDLESDFKEAEHANDAKAIITAIEASKEAKWSVRRKWTLCFLLLAALVAAITLALLFTKLSSSAQSAAPPEMPSLGPSFIPSASFSPSNSHSASPSIFPSQLPTSTSSASPSQPPTQPINVDSASPSSFPSQLPTSTSTSSASPSQPTQPINVDSASPSSYPSQLPTSTMAPSASPSQPSQPINADEVEISFILTDMSTGEAVPGYEDVWDGVIISRAVLPPQIAFKVVTSPPNVPGVQISLSRGYDLLYETIDTEAPWFLDGVTDDGRYALAQNLTLIDQAYVITAAPVWYNTYPRFEVTMTGRSSFARFLIVDSL